jgi:T5SS/PEP-CTERM-associated repeat protein
MSTIYRWIANSGTYDTASNWSPASGPPGPDDSGTIDVLSALVTANASSGFFIVGNTSNGSVTLTNGATLLVAGNGSVYVGETTNSAGSLVVSAGAHLIDNDGTNGDLIAHRSGSAGAVTITGAGSSWQSAGRIFVGNSGAGSLTISNGGSVNAGSTGSASDQSVYVGSNAGSTGVLTVSGQGSTLIANGRIGAGVAGTGTLLVLNGATVATTAAVIAGSSAIYAGGLAGGSGFISVSGAGSVLNPNGGEITVGAPNPTSTGALSSGTLIVAAGATVSAGASVDLTQYSALDVGNQTNGSGVFVLTGTGSTMNLTGQFTDGNSGVGAATISGGATLTAGDPTRATSAGIAIANATGGMGSLLIDGVGTRVSSTGKFSVGRVGTGSLTVSGGAVVSSTGNPSQGAVSMTIGASVGATGMATVTGLGSMIDLSAGLGIGGGGSLIAGGGVTVTPGGAGSLTIARGGVVSVTGGATIFSAGTVSLSGGAFYSDSLNLIGGGVSGAGTLTGAISGTGTLGLASGTVLDVIGAVASGVVANFAPLSNATLQLGAASAFQGTLANLTVGDTIDLQNFAAGNVSPVNGVLTVAGSGAQSGQTLSLQLSGSNALSFATNPDGNNGTNLVVTAKQPGTLPNVSGSFTSAVYTELAAVAASLIPPGTTPNVVSVVGGQSPGSAVAGTLNALVVTSATSGTTIAAPAGFGAAYLLAAGTALQDTTGGVALVDAAAGSSLTGAANDTLFGGNGGATLVATSGAETVVGGTGTNVIFGGGSTAQVLSQGKDLIVGSSGAVTVTATGTALYFGSSGATDFISSGNGGGTLIGGGGGNTITGAGGNQLIFGVSTLNYTGGTGAASIVGGVAGNTIAGGAGSELIFAAGSLSYSGGTGEATIVGGSGPMGVDLGAGGGVVYGSPDGNDTINSGTGLATLVAGGGGDNLIATGTANDVLAATGGPETINGSTSTGNLVLFAGSGTDVLTGGSGNDLFIVGGGNETLVGGSGANSFVFGAAAGTTTRVEVIDNFTSTDAIGLYGYGNEPGADQAALASATTSGGNTMITLPDGTSIVLIGAPPLQSYNFF